MKHRVGSILLMCALSIGFTQTVDYGVEITQDEFTGEESCDHFVVASPVEFTGISLVSTPELGTSNLMFVVRQLNELDDAVFNMFGVMRDDQVFVRFPSSGEVVEFSPQDVSVEVEFMESGYELAVILVSREFLTTLLSSTEDIRIRFSGGEGNADFTINKEIIEALANGFGKTCL